MKTSLAVRLLVDEYWRRDYLFMQQDGPECNYDDSICYLNFLRSQANSNKTTKGYAYTLAVREIEKA